MIQPEFVRAEPEHSEVLLELVRAYYAFDGIAFAAESVRRSLSLLLTTPTLGEAWLVLHAGKFVGFFVFSFGFDLEFGGRQATLTELYFVERARRRGFGSAALHFVQERLTAADIHTLELQVELDNAEARHFYERAGFVAETRLPLTKRW